jgi:dTDP-4-amino-4,6-dideoxygalactose transaminase
VLFNNAGVSTLVPFLDINSQNLALEPELADAFQRVLKSGQFILGPEVAGLEKELAEFVGAQHALGMSSGTDAILVALMALDIGPGDEVLCPAFTFFATAGCVARVGAKPVFVDVSPITYNIDVADAARKVTAATRAIIPVHLFGQCADMDSICELAAKHKLAVIEDAAQSLGARYRERQAGSIGDFGTFSFYPTKNLGGLGDGGLLVCRDEALAAKACALRNHGAEKTYFHTFVGGNFRLDAFQAAFLRVKFRAYESSLDVRRSHAMDYTEKLSKLPEVHLGTDPEQHGARMILPSIAEGAEHIWNQYTIRVPERRDIFREYLSSRGIQTGLYYPLPLNRQGCFAYLDQQSTCPVSDRLAEEVVSLPIYPGLAEGQRAEVVGVIRQFLNA